jgi:Ubiquitin-2 like Rad60 SUMO-like
VKTQQTAGNTKASSDPQTNVFLVFNSQINLRLILVSGKTKEFLFSPSESAGEIAKIVFEQWPEGEHS